MTQIIQTQITHLVWQCATIDPKAMYILMYVLHVQYTYKYNKGIIFTAEWLILPMAMTRLRS
jgi:hypothetical protein